MASTYPDARWTPLGAQTETRMTRHSVVCVHTMAGYLVSTDGYFRIGNGEGFRGTESHYGVGGKWGPDLGGGLDGAVWQWQDRAYGADANLDGKPRVISIETADNAVRPIQPWTPAQVSAITRLCAWECSLAAHADCPAGWTCREGVEWEGIRVAIPPVLIPDTQSHRRGLAYHAQGAADHTVGEWWSTTPSKDCPTAPRIAQFKTTVIPGVQQLLAARTDEEADELNETQARQLGQTWDWTGKIGRRVPEDMPTQLAELRDGLKALRADVEQIPAPAVYVKVPPAAEVYQVRDGKARHVSAEEWALVGAPESLIKKLDPARDAALLGQLGITTPTPQGA